MSVCIHCRAKKVNRPRGLCWHCYYTPGVRERYPPVNVYGRRGVGAGNSRRQTAAPTAAPAGSEEKLRAMEERAARGEAIFHADDSEGCLRKRRPPPVEMPEHRTIPAKGRRVYRNPN